MILVDVRHDSAAALRALDQLGDVVKGRGLARALNRAATTVRAGARREIRNRYNIAASRVNQVIQIKQATSINPEAVVYAKDRRLALAVFGVKTAKKTGDVTVKVLRSGPRKTVSGNPNYEGAPFVQTVGRGRHIGIFQRVGRERLPIKELFSVSIPGGLTNKVIADVLRRVAVERFGVELDREVKFRKGRAA